LRFFHIDKSPPPPKQSNPLAIAAAGVLIAVILLGIGIFIGLRIGGLEPPCCSAFDFPFDLDFGA
jgi:hypothetical protein